MVRLVDPLQYAGGFLVTGDYAVGSVDLTNSTNPSSGGFSTGTINISGVPANADILAAYLFWETINRTVVTNPEAGVQFNGSNVVDAEVGLVKRTVEDLGTGATCFSSGNQPLTMWAFKADVLRLLPMQMDLNGPTGKRLANGAHTVRLPDAGGGNQVPESAGAVLLVVYRNPETDLSLNPLRRIVVYDGLKRKPDLVTTMTQTLRGFYGSSSATFPPGVVKARITHIAASGQPNENERILFNDSTNTQIASNPFAGATSSERAYGSPTYNVSALMTPGNNSTGGYGETATTSVEHTGGGGYDCVTWNAIVFSTAIADVDHDGLPDALESAGTALKDPNNQTLPHLSAMGATTTQQDMFVEINGMKTLGPTTYGSWDPVVCNAVEALTNKFCAPFNAGAGPVPLVTSVPAPAHNHIPSAAVLNEVAEMFNAHGIKVHFDVGPVLGAEYALTPTSVPNRFVVGDECSRRGDHRRNSV